LMVERFFAFLDFKHNSFLFFFSTLERSGTLV